MHHILDIINPLVRVQLPKNNRNKHNNVHAHSYIEKFHDHFSWQLMCLISKLWRVPWEVSWTLTVKSWGTLLDNLSSPQSPPMSVSGTQRAAKSLQGILTFVALTTNVVYGIFGRNETFSSGTHLSKLRWFQEGKRERERWWKENEKDLPWRQVAI